MDSLANYVSDEKDILYMRGERKAREQIIINMLKERNLTIEQMARIADVSIDFVEQVKSALKKS